MCKECKKLAAEIDCCARSAHAWYHGTNKPSTITEYAFLMACTQAVVKRPARYTEGDCGASTVSEVSASPALAPNDVDPKTGLTGVQTEACEAILASGHLSTSSHRVIKAYFCNKPVSSLGMSEVNRALSLCGYPQLATRE